MKKLIYFLCCLASACILGYMIYRSWLMAQNHLADSDTVMWILGTIGWCNITFKIVTNDYNWTKLLCK